MHIQLIFQAFHSNLSFSRFDGWVLVAFKDLRWATAIACDEGKMSLRSNRRAGGPLLVRLLCNETAQSQ